MILNTNRLKIVSLSYEELFDYVLSHKGFVKEDEEEKKVLDYTVFPMSSAPIEEHLFYTFWCGYYEGEDILQCGFLRPPNENKVVEVWMHVKDEYMNKGFGTEAIKAMVQFAKDNGGIDFVGASIDTDNFASKRMVEKCRFEYSRVYEGLDIYFLKL